MVHVANPICDIIFMNVEDEYFSAIENRDTEILIRDKKTCRTGCPVKRAGCPITNFCKNAFERRGGKRCHCGEFGKGHSGDRSFVLVN